MTRYSRACTCATIALAFVLAAATAVAQSDRIRLQLNSSEAEAVLAILDKQAAGRPIPLADWQHLFSTEPYQRLKKREASLHRDFTDDDFRKFVLSPELARSAPELQRTLDAWKQADLAAAACRVLPYLPGDAVIHAKVFPMIKPNHNSFVYDLGTDPTIFLYLDPAVSAPKFENTVAHEMHHIGFASIEPRTSALLANAPANVKPALEWMGAFGEGFAMLAAAGSPDIDPHAASTPEEHARWDHDMANYNQDLRTLDQFFRDIIAGKFRSKDAIDEKAFTFFGAQGPWYTVGYKMAVTIERQYGRAKLIDCMVDPRELLVTYNQAAAILNEKKTDQKNAEPLALFSPELITAIEPKS
jgi:hypothetical protein